jgi:hypothetical protein
MRAEAADLAEQTFRLCEGVTVFVVNPEGRAFTVGLDIRDLNLFANGPRETLFKVYDPDGIPVVREFIPDDGCGDANFPDRIGGWDHELQYYANLYAKGSTPSFRWSAWSNPARLKTLVARNFDRPIPGGKKGVYRIVLAGTPDIYATLRLPSDLKTGFSGHPTFMHGHGGMMRKAYLYVPKGTSGIFYAFAEPDLPRSRRFKLTGPDGKVFFDGMALGGYTAIDGPWKDAKAEFGRPGEYDGKLMTLEVSDGPNDFLAKITFQQPQEQFGDYVGMGSLAVFCDDEATANAIQAGTQVVDGQVYWHPFQVRFREWLRTNAPGLGEPLLQELDYVFQRMRYLETGDARGTASWSNLAYNMGYYGCDIFRPGWVLIRRRDVPDAVKAILREGLIMAGDRLSCATHIEKVNGNAFSQINVALWYCHRATGDALQKERFETFWQRWTTEGWGTGSGLSRSGDSQEHFAHDGHYGSYLLDNWKASGNTWIKGGVGILADATDDPRFQKVYDRYRELYTYLYCREANGDAVPAVPWSARTHQAPHRQAANWEGDGYRWKGDPGPDLTVSVNGGNEWFAARRKGYYALTFHGRLAPEWLSRCFEGQLGFSGGTLCQFTVPGKGPVLAGTLYDAYGKNMDPSQWADLKIHSLVGEMWDRSPLIAAISEQEDARLDGNAVTGSGEVRNSHVKAFRRYSFDPGSIACEVRLAPSDYARVLSIWSHGRYWSEVREAWEMLPFLPMRPDGKTATSATAGDGSALTEAGTTTDTVRLDRGGFGVEIRLDKPRLVKRGKGNTVMIQVVAPVPVGGTPVPAGEVGMRYTLVPFGA